MVERNDERKTPSITISQRRIFLCEKERLVIVGEDRTIFEKDKGHWEKYKATGRTSGTCFSSIYINVEDIIEIFSNCFYSVSLF